ncbi:hypothetical protein [Parendozoicomonas haliclonae]|uniref:Uncharacterized protein n=1 Tax=Parendozoicomonas haliclonae TaxID=1960125 RepID=A0A1X7AIZ7_9GAMM|nr:hypothetical protein [Parendozoicomonas haliclonae]SMA45131.1 hypothetical protein EHSB41UT_01850 [Parendozoicomonas haliclonae]
MKGILSQNAGVLSLNDEETLAPGALQLTQEQSVPPVHTAQLAPPQAGPQSLGVLAEPTGVLAEGGNPPRFGNNSVTVNTTPDFEPINPMNALWAGTLMDVGRALSGQQIQNSGMSLYMQARGMNQQYKRYQEQQKQPVKYVQAADGVYAIYRDGRSEKMDGIPGQPQKIETAKDVNGRVRNVHTGELLFPDAKPEPGKQGNRQIIKGPDGRDRFVDDGSLVFPDVPYTPQVDHKEERALSKEYSTIKKGFASQVMNYRKLRTALESASGAGDIAAIFNFMKANDPQSVVRESEFDLGAQAAGVYAAMSNLFEKYKDGTRLPPEARQQFLDLTGQWMGLAAEDQRRAREDYQYNVKHYGFDERAVMGTPYDLEEWLPKQEGNEGGNQNTGRPTDLINKYRSRR